MANKNVLFEDKVYSQGVDIYWPSFGDGPHIISKNQSSKDENLYPRLLDENGTPKEFQFTPGEQLYLYNEEETDIRNSYLRMIKSRQHDLHLSRKVIVDDKYPEYIEYYRPFKRFNRKRELATMLGEYQIIFGRRCLIDQIGMCKYYLAWPEIREVILHDKSLNMKNSAKSVLKLFPHKISQKVANDAVRLLKDQQSLYFVLDMADSFPSDGMVADLEEIFSSNYFYIPSDKMYISEVYGGYTIQAEVLKICAKIPSVNSLRLIEEAVAHPFWYIEEQALSSIGAWVKNTSFFLSNNLVKFDKELLREIKKVFNKYDINAYLGSRYILRKNIKEY